MSENNNINEQYEEEYMDDYDEELEEILNEEPTKGKFRKPPSRVKRNRNIILAAILAIALAGGLYYFNKNQTPRTESTQTAEEIDQNSYNGSNIMRVDLNQVNKISFDLATADVRIQRSNTNPYVEYTHLYRGEEDVYTLDVSYENGELKLSSNIKGKELNMKNKIQIVRIFLPMDKAIDEIKGVVNAGDVKITDMEVRNFDLKVRSGHITFDNSFFGGSVSNDVGDIILNKTELLNTKLSTGAGDIIITDGKLGNKSDFTTQSGDIIISSTDSIDNYNVKANLEVGNFILGNISYRNIKDGFKKNNNAQKEVSLATKVGDIIFNKGEGAILEEEEYITNDPVKEDENESEYQYIDEIEEDQTEEGDVTDQTPTTDDATDEEEYVEPTDGLNQLTNQPQGNNN